MSAYFVVDMDVVDPDLFGRYRENVEPFIHKHGGEYLARGGTVEVFEGDMDMHRVVLFRFPSRDAIRTFLADPEYQDLKQVRFASAITRAFAVDGLD